MESMESKTPPLPKMILLLSFTPLALLKIDSVKSPTIAEMEIKNPKTMIFTIDEGKIFSL